MTNMPTEQLIKAAHKYDALQNEGGEGYNPYREELDRREREAGRAKSIADLKYELSRMQEAGYSNAATAAIRDQIKTLKQAYRDEWDAETTKTRRVEWNAFVSSLGKIDGKAMIKVYAKQAQQGWTVDDLKAAVKRHNL